MKKTRNNKKKQKKTKSNNRLKRLLSKLTRKRPTRNKCKKKSKAKKHLKSKSNTRKKNKIVMKGGAIPFSELNPSRVLDRITDQFGGHFADNAQPVPPNLESTSSVVDQPYLDQGPKVGLGVAGGSATDHFATP